MMGKARRILVLGTLVLPLAAAAAGSRGVWWWTSANHAWGVDQVLGNPAKEADMVRFLKEWNFGRVYCSFSASSRADPALIRAWNAKLHAAGVASQFLLSENTWIFPKNRANLLSHIQAGLIDFNAAATNMAQRYDGLHLDIEPHGLPGWRAMEPSARKACLLQLRDTFQAVRAYLDGHGAADVPVYADLPVWYDQVPKPVVWELQHFAGETRVGLEASAGTGKTWPTFGDLVEMVRTEAAAGSPPRPVDGS